MFKKINEPMTKKKKTTSRLGLILTSWLLFISFLIGVIELSSFLAYSTIFKSFFSVSHIVEQQNDLFEIKVDTLTANNKSDCVIHPYYGYAHNDNFSSMFPPQYATDSAAELGFYSPKSLTPFDHDGKFILAITGGSVAHLFASQASSVLLNFVKKLPEAQGKIVELFDLANWAYKQPQQLIILADLLHRGARFDLVINIDGLNELTLSSANARGGVSPFFPSQWETAAAVMPSKAAMEAYGQVALLQRWRVTLARSFRAWPHDPFLGLTWRLLDVTLAKQIVALRTQATSVSQARPGDAIRLSDNGKIMLGPNRWIDPMDLADQAVASWARASAIMADLVRASGGRYVHVLQPNQYVPDSKKLTLAEKNVAYLSDAPNKSLVEQGYPLLREAGIILQDCGINFIDMTMVFHDVDASLYEDTCCHFNKQGNELLAAAIGRALASPPPADMILSLGKLERRLNAPSFFDHARLLRESTLDVDLVQEASVSRLTSTGLADIEGSAEARWRWGMGLATVLSFSLPGAVPVTLRYALASPFADQEVTVVFNGQTLDRQTGIARTDQLVAPPATAESHFTLAGKSGENTLELRYRLANGPEHVLTPGETRPLAVIFRQLRLTVEHPESCRLADTPSSQVP